jgi:hypothetical protein
MGRRRKQNDIEQFGEMLDPNITLAVLLTTIPSSLEKVFPELEKPEGMGRKLYRQWADHYLSLLDSMATARREGRLNEQQTSDYATIMRRFLPIMGRLRKLHGRIPKQVEEDANLYGTEC